MTISEEKKLKILDLYNKGVSKKDIARLEEISYPSIRSILKEGDTEQIKKEKKKVVETKLNAIFNYEDYTDETVVNLIFNLKRIGMDSGRDLGQFIEDIEFIFDVYHKHSVNPIKLFDFLLDVSNELALITDHITPELFLKTAEEYCERGIYLNKLEAYILELKQKHNELVDSKIIELKDLNYQISISQKEKENLESLNAQIMMKLIDDPNKEKLKKALERIAELELVNQNLIKKVLIFDMEIKQNDKEKKEAERENLLFRTLIEKIKEKYPNELKQIIKEVDVKNAKENHNTAKGENNKKEA